jgi:hypothetical protein
LQLLLKYDQQIQVNILQFYHGRWSLASIHGTKRPYSSIFLKYVMAKTMTGIIPGIGADVCVLRYPGPDYMLHANWPRVANDTID